MENSDAERADWASRHLVLIGEMGVGKTTVGRRLANLVARPLLDSDDMLAKTAGMNGRRYAELKGVEALHDLELRLFLDAVASSDLAVIAPAASVVDHASGRSALKEQCTIWLHAPDYVVRSRLQPDDHRRSVAESEMTRLLDSRLAIYREVSSVEVDTGTGDADECADRIAATLA